MTREPKRGRRYEEDVKKLTMLIDPSLHRELKYAALDADLSVTALVTRLIQECVRAAQVARTGGER